MPPSLFSTTRPPCTRSNHLRLLLLATIAFSPDPASAWIFGKWLARTDRAALQRRDTPQFGFFDPHLKDNGNMLTAVPNTYPAGLGEPLNVIISANSDAQVLKDTEDDGGLRNYFQSLSFSSECLGQSLGSKQAANLGDGHGLRNETAVIRYNYGDPYVGSCRETIQGGNHFRYWTQNGPDANSGAIFMAVSYEQPIDKGHDIIVNGYNLARDWLVGNATQVAFADPNPLSFVPTPDEIASSSSMSVASLGSIASTASVASVASLASISSLQALTRTSIAGNSTSLPPSSVAPTPTPTPTPTPAPAAQPNILLNASGGTGNIAPVPGGQFIGTTSANNYTYQTTATYTTGLLGNTSTGVNHYITVEEGGRPAMDGMVAVLVVKIISRPDGESAAFATAAPSFSALFLTVISSFLLISS